MRALLDLAVKTSGAEQSVGKFETKLHGLSNAANMAKTALAGIAAGGLLAGFKNVLGAASDVQESTEKFKVVFADVEAKASSLANNLAKNFNYAKSAAISSLADTGDILSGFGMQAGMALDLSDKVNRLAADLASFTNYAGGAAGASEALTKALLGEREQAKMLGLVISEEAVQAQMSINSKNGEVYATQQAAKAYATYKVALSQSPNAIGDMARATEKYQYRMTALSNSVLTLKENIGDALIAPASSVIDSINGMVKSFNDMDPATRTVIVRAGAAAAILGTLGTVVGGLYAAFKTYCAISNIATATTAINSSITGQNTAENVTNANSNFVLGQARTAAETAEVTHTAIVAASTAAMAENTLSIITNSEALGGNILALESNGAVVVMLAKAKQLQAQMTMANAAALSFENQTLIQNAALTQNVSTSNALALRSENTALIGVETFTLAKQNETRALLANVAALEMESVAYAAAKPKVTVLGVTTNATAMSARAGGKTGSGSFLLGSLFSKLKIGKLAGGWTSSFKNIFGSIGKLGTSVFRGIGFAVTKLIGPVAFVTGSMAAMGMVFKRLPVWLEMAIDQCGPIITKGLEKLVAGFPDIAAGAGKKLYGFFDGAWKGLRDFGLRIGILGATAIHQLTGKEMPEITTETQRNFANDKRAKALEKSAQFTQNAVDAEKALQSARLLTTEKTAQTIKVWSTDMRRMSMTKDQQEAAARGDEIKKSRTSFDNQINLGSTLAGNRSSISDLLARRDVLMGQHAEAQKNAEAAQADIRLSETDVSGNSAMENWLGTNRTSEATKKAQERFKTSMASASALESEIGNINDEIRSLETNSDPKLFITASKEFAASLAAAAGTESKLGKQYSELRSQFEAAAKDGDKDAFMESATAYFKTMGESAEAGSELGSVYESTLEEMGKAQARGNTEAFMQALNRGYAAAAKDAGEDSNVAATFRNLENGFKAAGQRFDPGQFMKSVVDLETKLLDDFIEGSKYADEMFGDAIDARLSNAKFAGEMKGGIAGINLQKDAQTQTLDDLLTKQAKHQTANENLTANQERVDTLNQEMTQLQTDLQDGKITDKDAYEKRVGDIKSEMETLLQQIAEARTPKEMQELQEQINDTRTEIRDLEQGKFDFRVERFKNLSSDRQFNADQMVSQIEQSMGRETKHGLNLSSDYTASAKRLSDAVSSRTQTVVNDLDSQIKMIADSLATDDISDDERYERERQIAELKQQKQTTLIDAQNKRLDLSDTLQDRLKKQKDLKSQFAKVYDDMLLKEAKTADQKAAVYSRQFNELSGLMANARSDEEYLGYAQQMISLSEQIKQNYLDEAQQAMNRTWKTEGGVKAMTAGSADAASIQNRVFNTSQKNVEKNTARMVEIATIMNSLLGKINDRQDSGFDVEVANS